MAKVLDNIVGSVGTSTRVEVKMVQTGHPHAKGGLLQNTHATQIVYVGGATQTDVDATTGWPLAAGKSIYIEGEIGQNSGFWVLGSGAATTFMFLPSSTD